MLALCLWAVGGEADTKTYQFSFSQGDYAFQELEDGILRIEATDTDFFLQDDSLSPAFPYRTFRVLRPRATATSYTVNVEKQLIYSGVEIEANPLSVPTNKIGTVVAEESRMAVRSVLSPVEFVGDDMLRGYAMASFNITPFVYDSTTKDLYFVSKVTLTLTGEAEAATGGMMPVRAWGDNADVRRLVCNPEELPLLYPEALQAQTVSDTESVEYLVVTTAALSEAFEPLVRWKTRKGVRAETVTLEEIYEQYEGESNTVKIKQCLKDYFVNRGLKWVLLGGDNTVVPVQGCFISCNGLSYSDAPSDLFYACFDKTFNWNTDGDNRVADFFLDDVDLYPEIFVARLPVRTGGQVEAFVDKLLKYETAPNEDGYVNRMLLSGIKLWNTWDGKSDAHHRSETMYAQYIAPYWDGQVSYLYDTGNSFGTAMEANADNLWEQLETGYHFMHMATHGSADSWALEGSSYDRNDAAMQTNEDATIITTMACLTNAFDSDSDPCLSEAFIRNEDGACLAYIGCSREGWGTGSKTTALGKSFQYDASFFEALLADASSEYRLGAAFAKAKEKHVASCNGNNAWRWVQLALNLMGDPEMPVYTDEVQEFANVSVAVSGSNVTVSTGGVAGCTIALTSQDGGDSYFSVAQGASHTFQNVDVPFYVTVTKHNYVPFLYPENSVVYVQNRTFTSAQTVTGGRILAGKNVTTSQPQGDVVVKAGADVTMKAFESTTLEGGFECEKGGVLTVEPAN